MERPGAIEVDAASEPIARAIGNLAGVVEWANDAFASLSGIPLGETVDKPVGRLLERAGIGLDVVELVAQQFFEGQVCRIAFPFERPDGRRIEIVLDVTALRDEQGEIERFLAEARERDRDEPGLASEQRPAPEAKTPLRSAPNPTRRASGSSRPTRVGSDLSLVVAAFVDRLERSVAGADAAVPWRGVALDVELAPSLPPVDAPRAALGALLRSLVEASRLAVAAAANAGAVITLSTTMARPFRRIVSPVHPIASGPPDPIDAWQVVLEVHDTGLPLPLDALERLRRAEAQDAGGVASRSPREALLLDAARRARALGARLRFDATPGCGNQVLALFPCAARSPGAEVGAGATR